MMETTQNYDIQAAERIFKKVVHPGLNTMRIVDRNGLPLHNPVSRIRPRSFVLSPRGVPTKVPNHVYSGRPPNRYTDVSTSDTPDLISPERFGRQSMPGSPDSKPMSRQYSSSHMSKKRAVSTTPTPTVFNRNLPMTKSASSQRYLSGVPSEKRSLQDNRSRWNTSSQGNRLENEWDNLSSCRALKRSSEIVSHRVDRMYFMSGNSIKLQPRYQVDDEEFKKLKDMAKSRQTTRSVRKTYDQAGHVVFCGYYTTEDEQKDHDLTNLSMLSDEDVKNEKTYYMLKKDKEDQEYFEDDGEREMIPSALSSCMMCDQGKHIHISISDESGIHEDFRDEVDKGDADDEADSSSGIDRSRHVSKVEIRPANVHAREMSVDIFDILSHGDRKKLSDCMLKLLQNYPPHKLAESRGSMRELAHRVLTSGLNDLNRKRRSTKGSYSLKQNVMQTEFKLPFRQELSVQKKESKMRKEAPKVKLMDECLVQKFPVRRPSTKFLHLQCQNPVTCTCRKDLHKDNPLKVSGTQAPIFIKV